MPTREEQFDFIVQEIAFGNQSFTNINLSNFDLTVGKLERLFEALKVNKTVKSLDLSYNQINNRGASVIANALQENSSLKILNLSGNLISNYGLRKISEALLENISLETVDLRNNPINYDNNQIQVQQGILNNALKLNTLLSEFYQSSTPRMICFKANFDDEKSKIAFNQAAIKQTKKQVKTLLLANVRNIESSIIPDDLLRQIYSNLGVATNGEDKNLAIIAEIATAIKSDRYFFQRNLSSLEISGIEIKTIEDRAPAPLIKINEDVSSMLEAAYSATVNPAENNNESSSNSTTTKSSEQKDQPATILQQPRPYKATLTDSDSKPLSKGRLD